MHSGIKLVLYADFQYIHQNYSLVIRELIRQKGDEYKFLNVVKHPISELKKEIKNASLIVLDNSILFACTNYNSNDLLVYYEGNKGIDFYHELICEVVESSGMLVYIFGIVDIHSSFSDIMKKLIPRINAIISSFHHMPPERESLESSMKDQWMLDTVCPAENWKILYRDIPSRFQMLHSLSNSEVSNEIISACRKWDVSICGERYAPRKQAMSHLKKSNLSIAPYRRNDILIGGVSRVLSKAMLPSSFVNRNFIKMRRLNQKYILDSSSLSFTCGSAYNYPVRKFFEIPAHGSLLIAYPFTKMDHCGFIDGVNYIKTENIDDISDQVRMLKRNPKILTKIAQKGKELVFTKHIIQKRVADLAEFIRLVSLGKSVVAEFNSGEFIISSE